MKKTECNYNLKSNKCISLFTGLSLEIALSGEKHIGIKEQNEAIDKLNPEIAKKHNLLKEIE